jgi:pyruvate/2-oxoglutarate dehydrogenase complex dihydrolipoamide acyltransferase (E2) component
VSGQVEATDVQVAAQVGGRLIELRVDEGDRVKAGDLVARLDAADAELALARARAERDQSDAQLRLLVAGARVEDIRQADAQAATADAEVRAVEVELASAQADVDRFEALLASNSGHAKARRCGDRRDGSRAPARRGTMSGPRASRRQAARGSAARRVEALARVAAAAARIAIGKGNRRRHGHRARVGDRDREARGQGSFLAGRGSSSPISITRGRMCMSTNPSCPGCASARRHGHRRRRTRHAGTVSYIASKGSSRRATQPPPTARSSFTREDFRGNTNSMLDSANCGDSLMHRRNSHG